MVAAKRSLGENLVLGTYFNKGLQLMLERRDGTRERSRCL